MSTPSTTAGRVKTAKHPGRIRRRWQRMSRRKRRIITGVLVLFFLGFIGLLGAVYAAARIPLPDDNERAQATIIEYSDGSRLGQLAKENRVDIPLKDVPPHVRDAVLAAEDRKFYEHSGISLTGIARAAYRDIRGGGARQGGSTITQQYARNAFLSKERTFARKFREAIIAVKLERKHSKDQILEWYLNTIYFGRGASGIEAASRTYFGVPARRLTTEQGAVLAALIRAPESGDPAVNALGCSGHWFMERNNMVAAAWYEHGTRLLNVNASTGEVTQKGFFQPVVGSASAAHWIDNSYIYVVDYERGIDVLRYDPNGRVPTAAELDASWLAKAGVVSPLAEQERLACRLVTQD